MDYPANLHEYHVFVHDMENPHKREYKSEEHQIKDIDSGENRHLKCLPPVTIYDLRPYGSHRLSHVFQKLKKHRKLEVIFVGHENRVEYVSNAISVHDSRHIGPLSNLEGWNLLNGVEKFGRRVKLEEHAVFKAMFEGYQNQVKYNRVFFFPTVWQGEKRVPDEHFMSLLKNENGECISYLYYLSDDYVQFVLPQVEDKAALLKDLFENVLFWFFSEFFPRC